MQWYWRGDFVRELPDAAIDAHIAAIAEAPTEKSLMQLYPIDGAVRRRASDATAWACRDATWSMVIAGIRPRRRGRSRSWRGPTWEAVHPYDLGGAYPNFMRDDQGAGRLRATLRGEIGRGWWR